MMRRFTVGAFAVVVLFLTGMAPAAYAGLERVGPVVPGSDGYPAWYQDTTGLALEFCRPTNQAELNDGWCLILPADVPNGAAPETAFNNYSEEHFYWAADAGIDFGASERALLVLGLEAAFNLAPAAGDQIVFGRVRITISTLPASGDYKVYTPFGVFNFPGLVEGDKLFFTSDIGITCGAQFDCALNSQVGPFLLPSATPGGPEDPPLTQAIPAPDPDPAHFGGVTPPVTPYPGTGKAYIADPARLGPVTGSPLPEFVGSDLATYNHNIFRVEGPAGSNIGGAGIDFIQTTDFSLMGRVMSDTIPGRVTVNRASYTDQASPTPVKKLDVFATAFPTTQGRLPGGTALAQTDPYLGYFDAPCATNPATGAVTGPPAGAVAYFEMFNSGTRWWGQNEPAVIPAQVCVQDTNSQNAAGQTVTAYFQADVTDEVYITDFHWDPASNGGTLTVAAVSSDQVTAPTLNVSGYGPMDPATGTLVVSPVPAPPHKVSVVSARGGVATVDVTTGIGMPVSPTVPRANADTLTIDEDCSAVPATGCAAPAATIDPRTNDTLAGAPLAPGAGAVLIAAAPRLGTAAVNADNTISYTPLPNANGTDLIGYTVTVDGVPSNEGFITVHIRPINDIPAAVSETSGTTNGKAVTINVLANDTDVDGIADLANAVIASLPAAGATLTCNNGVDASVDPVCIGGLVTITPAAGGTYSFTYYAQDRAGALSASPATVTVTVNASENIVIAKSQYVTSKNRWRVEGSDSVDGSQTLTIAYNNGTFADGSSAVGYPIGTASVAAGTWAMDIVGTGRGNPDDAAAWAVKPTRLQVTSPLGGSGTANISVKR